jgi:hypothetical protein
MEAVRSTEMSLNFHQNTRSHVHKNSIVRSHSRENFRSQKFLLLSIREENNQFSGHYPSTSFLFEIKIRTMDIVQKVDRCINIP